VGAKLVPVELDEPDVLALAVPLELAGVGRQNSATPLAARAV
jgi:hypothetical protein